MVNRLLPIILLFAGIGIIFFAVNSGSVIVPGTTDSPKKVVACDVEIKNILLGTAEIGNFNCRKERSCTFGFSAIPFGVFGQKGEIRLLTSDATASQQYDVGGILSSGIATKRLSICTEQSSGTLQLADDKNNIISTKSWSA